MRTHAFCALPFSKIHVDAKGHVRSCCHQDVDLGNVLEQDFEAIWRGSLAQEVRQATLRSELHSVCRVREVCPHLYTSKEPNLPIPSEDGRALPLQLELDLPNTECNIGGKIPTAETACLMCGRGARNFQPEVDRTDELVSRLRFLMPDLHFLQIQGLAEVFWKDRIFDVLGKFGFEQFRERCWFTTHTNGTVFPRDRRRRFLEACPKATLNFSIDAATPETYRAIRRLDAFDLVIENIRGYVTEKGPGQYAHVMFNLNEINLGEAVQMVELAASLGVNAAVFSPTSTIGEARADLSRIVVSRRNAWRFAEAEHQMRSRASELGVLIRVHRPLDLGLAKSSPNGHLDGLFGRQIVGWARDPISPASKLEIDLVVNERFRYRAMADLERPDLKDAGLGDCAFVMSLDEPVRSVRAYLAETGRELYGSPWLSS